MYKSVLLIITLITLISCKKEGLTILDSETETSFVQDAQLKSYISNIAAHDGTFDDVIDASPCFSINFPYEIVLNGNTHSVNTVNDLLPINATDEVLLTYPVTITFATYNQTILSTETDLRLLINRCSSGELYNESIACVDIVYPVSVGVYNTETSDFETVLFDHDKRTFQSIASFSTETLAAIRYPIEIFDGDGILRIIENNEQFKSQVSSLSLLCE